MELTRCASHLVVTHDFVIFLGCIKRVRINVEMAQIDPRKASIKRLQPV
jgi:hypothetical protein